MTSRSLVACVGCQATAVASLLKDEVMEGQRQLVALAASAASVDAADGPRAVTMQEVEARDPTIEIAAQLQQKQCVQPPCRIALCSCRRGR